jgi:hypothetical protein
MHDHDFAKLAQDLEAALLDGAATVAILGATSTTLRLITRLAATGLDTCIRGVYTDQPPTPPLRVPVRPLQTWATAKNSPVCSCHHWPMATRTPCPTYTSASPMPPASVCKV